MATPKNRSVGMRRVSVYVDKNGYTRCKAKVNGKFVYLGNDVKEAEKKLRAILREEQKKKLTEALPVRPAVTRDRLFITLCGDFLEDCEKRDQLDFRDLAGYRTLVKWVMTYNSNLTISEWTPAVVRDFRKWLAAQKWTNPANGRSGHYGRQQLNKMVGWIKLIFSFGYDEGYCSFDQMERVRRVKALRAGEEEAAEMQERQIVTEEQFEATIGYMRPYYQRIFRLLYLTGMRPIELCRMRRKDIAYDGDIWWYRPYFHKTINRGKTKTIPLGSRCYDLIADLLDEKAPDEYLFTRNEALEEMYALRAVTRRTKPSPAQKRQMDEAARRRANKPVERFAPSDFTRELRAALKKAAAAGVAIQPWKTYALRDTAISRASLAFGPEGGQAVAGHSSLRTTEYYDHSQRERQRIIAKQLG